VAEGQSDPVEEEVHSKHVHVKLDRLTHTRFKSNLVELGVSMQEAFEYFAKCLAEGNKSAVRLVEQIKRQRVKDELAGTGLKPGLGRKRRGLGELDHDTLYDLINEEEDTDEAPLPSQG
jgi:hypothetical protein